MASIFDVADWFLCKEEMTHKKLQKLCYYAQAWGYALLHAPLCDDTQFQAWAHGPVSPELYEKYKGRGWEVIPQLTECPDVFSEEELDLLESVYLTYGDMSANALEALSHSEPPWQRARSGLPEMERGGEPIRPEDMQTYYMQIYTGDEK
jgi:uncharacterized phage-associated protein